MIIQVFILLFLIGVIYWLLNGIKSDIKELIQTIKNFKGW